MDEYREKLKVSIAVSALCCLVLTVVSVLGFAAEAGLVELTPVVADDHWQSMWRGLISGAAMGVLGIMVFGLIRSLRAMKDERLLKKYYVQAHDERSIQIWTKARAGAMQTFLMLGCVAFIVAGYFNATVSLTIMACIVSNSLIGLAFKVYYERKF